MWGVGVGLAAALVAIFSDEAMRAASDAAELFARGVMPALFPMLVLASLLPARRREPFAFVALFSLLAGSPASARRVRALCDAGGASGARLTALLGVTGVMSPMFFTGTLASWLGDSRAAWLMLLCHWLGAGLAGAAGACAEGLIARRAAKGGVPAREAFTEPENPRASVLRALPEALKSSAQALLAVCAAMMLFSIAAALIRSALSRALPEWTAQNGVATAVMWAALEIGGGSAELAALGAPKPLMCAMCGFGGLSLWMQNLLFTGDSVSPVKLLALRAAHAAASFGLCSIVL